MKKITIFLLAIVMIASCTKEHSKEYTTLSGTLKNNKDSIITIIGVTGKIKTIEIQKGGTFKDTLKVKKDGIYTFQISNVKKFPIFLKNGFNLTMNADSDDLIASIKFQGEGASNSNYIMAQLEEGKKIGNPGAILALEKDAFDKKISSITKGLDSVLNSYDDIDSLLITLANQQKKQFTTYLENTYNANRMLGKGKPSPKFNDYIDIKGGKKSLDSFKGKYVYIDVWATWCGPCIQQIPYLQKLEKEYHNKNIEFVSISTDESRRSGGSWDAAEKKWRDFVKAKQLGGVQLWAGQDTSFQTAYQITGIPRFILIDPKGNIVSENAPRPSESSLKTLFTSLGI